MRALALTVLVLLAGCERIPWSQRDAEGALHAYLGALVEGQTGQAYRHLSGADRAARTEGEWRAAAPRYARYRIVRVDRYADLASALVEVVPAPGGGKVSAPNPVSGSSADPAPAAVAAEQPPQTQSITLVREGAEWKVYLGETARAAPASAAGESPLETRAARPPERRKPVPPPVAQPAPNPASAIQAERDGLQLYGLRAEYYRSYSGRRTPGVEFKLRNRSARTITRAAVTVYFLDAAGSPIWEEKYLPVRADPDGFLSTPALKPGYIWQVERGKFLLAESVPEEWKSGSVRAEITEIQYAPDTPPG